MGFDDSSPGALAAYSRKGQLSTINRCVRKGKGDSSLAFLNLSCRMGNGMSAGSVRASRKTQTIPIAIAFTQLPVFMLSTSVSVMLVGKPTAITMADGTFTGNALWRPSSLGWFFFFAFQVRVYQSRRRIITARVRF